jgi:hypothetical protein
MGLFTKSIVGLLLGLAFFEAVSANSSVCGETRLSILKSQLTYEWNLPGFPSLARFWNDFLDGRLSEYDIIQAENITLGDPSDLLYLDGQWTFTIRRERDNYYYSPSTTLVLTSYFTHTPKPLDPICDPANVDIFDPTNPICFDPASSVYDPFARIYTELPGIQITIQPLIVIDHDTSESARPSVASQTADSTNIRENTWYLPDDTYTNLLVALEDSLMVIFQITLVQAGPLTPTHEIDCNSHKHAPTLPPYLYPSPSVTVAAR